MDEGSTWGELTANCRRHVTAKNMEESVYTMPRTVLFWPCYALSVRLGITSLTQNLVYRCFIVYYARDCVS